MFNFLEKAEILKEREKQRKKEYGKELQLQIEQNRLKKLQEKTISNNQKTKIIDITQTSDIGNKILLNRNNDFIKHLQKLKISIDNSLIKSGVNNKSKSLKYNNSNIKNLTNLRINTDNNLNGINHKNFLFIINENSNNTEKKDYFKQNTELKMKKSLSQMIKGISSKHNNLKNKNNHYNKNLMEEIEMQFLFKGFVDQQIKTINDYATNLEDIFYEQYNKNNKDIILFNHLIETEKNKALQSIKNEKNKLKNKFGFFPLEIIYDSRIEQLFNKILNKIISIYSSFNQIKINNFINQENSSTNHFPFKSKFLDTNLNQNFLSKFNIINNKINLTDKINLEDDLKFFYFWRNKYESEIKKEKTKLVEVNETINLKNFTKNINNARENNLQILPANNIFKNVKFRPINKIRNNKNENNDFKLPDINLKKPIFKKRNNSANNKMYEKFSFLFKS